MMRAPFRLFLSPLVRPLARMAALLLAAVLAAVPLPALACTVGDDYRVPTNLELAGQAELILLAKVAGGTGLDGDSRKWSVTLHPIAAIKGDLPKRDLVLPGLALGPERFLVLSNPYDFQGAHPLSYIGGCVRYMFPRGTTALFFLKRSERQWSFAGGPFSRWAEDVPGADAPWVRLAALYARAAALPPDQQGAALEAEKARLAALADDPVAQLMAADIARQLQGPNPAWNASMKEQMKAMGMDKGADNGSEDPADSDNTNAVDATLKAMTAPAPK